MAHGRETDVPSTFVLTGAVAVGKSTVADLLARYFPRSVHLRGDVFRKMIVAGRDPIVPPLGPEVVRQLELRRQLAALAAGEYLRDGFTVVLQDIYVGLDLSDILTRLHPPLYLVALTARLSAPSITRSCSLMAAVAPDDGAAAGHTFSRWAPVAATG